MKANREDAGLEPPESVMLKITVTSDGALWLLLHVQRWSGPIYIGKRDVSLERAKQMRQCGTGKRVQTRR